MTNDVTFKSKSGSSVSGALAEPEGSGKAGAIVLIQEWWGLNDHVKSLVDRFAKQGFLVLAPDLYHGKVTKDANEAGKLMSELDTMAAVDEIAGAVAFLQEHPRSNGKVGVTGFCMGGALTLAAACHVPGVSAAVVFYGIPPANKVDYAKVTTPVQAHVAQHDDWVTVARMEDVKSQIEAAGAPFEMFTYDAQHAFVNDTRPEVHSPDDAKLALDRAWKFFHQHLG